MKIKKNKIGQALTLAMLLGTSSIAHAQGDKTGGGGDITACLENGKITYSLLDMLEAKRRNEFPDLGAANLSIQDKIVLAKARYQELDPVRAKSYLDEAMKMAEDISDLESGKTKGRHGLVVFSLQSLKDINDANEINEYRNWETGPTAEKCAKGQLVRQETPLLPSDPYYTIDLNQWNLLDNDQKVATLYHEAIYKEFRGHWVSNSVAARHLNGMIISGSIAKLPSGDYFQFVSSQNLGQYLLDGKFNVSAEKMVLNDRREIVQLKGDYVYDFGNFKINISSPQFVGRTVSTAVFSGNMSFSSDKKQVSIPASGASMIRGGEVAFLPNQILSFTGLTKNYDGGSVSVSVDSSGKALRIQESGYFNKPLSEEMRSEAWNLMACTKRTIDKKMNEASIQDLGALLTEARDAIKNEDASTMRALTSKCKTNYSQYSKKIRLKKFPGYQEGALPKQSWFAPSVKDPIVRSLLANLVSPSLNCNGFGMSVSATALIGATVKLAELSCTFSNGSRKVYAGPGLGLGWGLGASFKAGVIRDLNSDSVNTDLSATKSGLRMISTAGKPQESQGAPLDLGDMGGDLTLLLWNFSSDWDGLKVVDQYSIDQDQDHLRSSTELEKRMVSVGLAYENQTVGMGMIKLFSKKDDYTSLIQTLTTQILTKLP